MRLTLGAVHLITLVVFRPGSEDVSSQLFDELLAVFETLVVFACPVVISGDFNVKFQFTDDFGARRMHELLTCFDMVQHVSGPTYCRGNTLDLVITPSGCPLSGVDVEPAVIVIIVIIIFIYSAIMQTLQRRWTDRCVCGVTDRLSHEQATTNFTCHGQNWVR
jgi:hypothetical protein